VTTVTQAVEQLVRATVGLTDDDMGRAWAWRMYDEEGLRFALLMAHHELRDLAVRLAAQRPAPLTQAQAILAQYHQAYRDLTGVLATVRNEDLDRPPAEGEWPVREACEHMLGAEYGFLNVCRFGLRRRRAGDPNEPAETEWDAYVAPHIEERKAVIASLAVAGIEQFRDAFATIHIRVLRELGDIRDDEIDAPAWFWDGPMPIRFRLHRFEEHLRQHTIQLDKTLAGIGRPPTEADRLVRNVYGALADVESEPATAEELRAQVAKTIAERAAALSR
jgi:uncharacterized damage-inducible protein DinB